MYTVFLPQLSNHKLSSNLKLFSCYPLRDIYCFVCFLFILNPTTHNLERLHFLTKRSFLTVVLLCNSSRKKISFYFLLCDSITFCFSFVGTYWMYWCLSYLRTVFISFWSTHISSETFYCGSCSIFCSWLIWRIYRTISKTRKDASVTYFFPLNLWK